MIKIECKGDSVACHVEGSLAEIMAEMAMINVNFLLSLKDKGSVQITEEDISTVWETINAVVLTTIKDDI